LCTELRVTFIICLFFEPTVIYEDSDVRHWRFIYESVQDLQDKLNPTNSKLYFFHSEVQPVFAELLKHYNINTVFSHQLVTSAPSIGI
jgi:deoxyribodipyrimidine photo-lyase